MQIRLLRSIVPSNACKEDQKGCGADAEAGKSQPGRATPAGPEQSPSAAPQPAPHRETLQGGPGRWRVSRAQMSPAAFPEEAVHHPPPATPGPRSPPSGHPRTTTQQASYSPPSALHPGAQVLPLDGCTGQFAPSRRPLGAPSLRQLIPSEAHPAARSLNAQRPSQATPGLSGWCLPAVAGVRAQHRTGS